MDTRYEQLHKAVLGSGRVVFFGGAGVSTESGIPDFRSQDGLYQQKFAWPPEEMLSRSFFDAHPEEFYRFHQEKVLLPALAAVPNAAHRALAQLEADGHLSAVVTQNIDGLHQKAGSQTVWELHGSIHRNSCTSCGAAYNAEELLQLLDLLEQGDLPLCTRAGCGALIKPDVVLYEEPLNSAILEAAADAVRHAEVLIIGGTSLVVNPAASLVNLFRGDCLVVINKGETWRDSAADLLFRENIGEVLGSFLPSKTK
ncbi:MAG: NAD-dependent protein deacylase [Coriobacteriales bacterium]|jgi:NAD-dependent deacetylase|nr:NAD-dependent protein deacylase [Coriobacteriales bacterium]